MYSITKGVTRQYLLSDCRQQEPAASSSDPYQPAPLPGRLFALELGANPLRLEILLLFGNIYGVQNCQGFEFLMCYGEF